MAEQKLDLVRSLDFIPVGIAILDADLRFVFCNKMLAEINGVPVEDHIGRTIWEIVPDVAGEAEKPFRSVFESGLPIRNLRVVGENLSGSARSCLENVEPVPDENGTVRHIIVSVHEASEVEELATAHNQAQSYLHASQQLNPDGFAVMQVVRDSYGGIEDLIWEYANPACQRFVSGRPLVGRKMFELVPEARELALAPITEALETGQATGLESTVERDRRLITHQVKFIPIDSNRVAVTYRDVSHERRAAQERDLLLAEYRHRIKNMLTVVLSLSWQLARYHSDSASMNEALQRHLRAMAQAQDYVGLHPDVPVDLGDLVNSALAAFKVPALHINGGGAVSISHDAAVPLALFLNELATNALKHGALTPGGGEATLSWEYVDGCIELEWCECGRENSVSTVVGSGFGQKLMNAVASMLPDGNLETKLKPDGFCASLIFRQ